jgi:hypothetical protein
LLISSSVSLAGRSSAITAAIARANPGVSQTGW